MVDGLFQKEFYGSKGKKINNDTKNVKIDNMIQHELGLEVQTVQQESKQSERKEKDH